MTLVKNYRLSEPQILPPHILVEATVSQLSIDPRFLRPGSSQLVIAECVICNQPRTKQFRLAVSQSKCLACSNRLNAAAPDGVVKRSVFMKNFYAAGGKHPTKGVGHSAVARAKIRRSRVGLKLNLSEESKEKLRRHCNATLNNPITKAAAADKNRLRKGALNPAYGKPPAHAKKIWHVDSEGNKVCFRSTWEFKFAVYLDQKEVTWQYEKRTFSVTYELRGQTKEGSYTPDFKTEQGWYEVKGRWTDEGLGKFNAFKDQYPDEKIKVIDRAWLKAKGLL